MYHFEKLLFAAYFLCVLTGSYLAVSTLKNLYKEARELEVLASAADIRDGHKVLVFDAIEPATGD